jgi:hypothetical protein
MLPDFPSIKSQLQTLVSKRLQYRVRAGDPVVAMIGHSIQHEGDRRIYGTVEGKQKELDYKKLESSFSISGDEIKSLTLVDIIKRIDKAAEEMSGHMARTIFTTINQVTEEAGTIIDGGGKPFTFETFLEALDKVGIDFDEETKQPHMPALVMSPDLFAKIKDKIPEWEKNEEYTRRFNEIMKQKYEEWYARECNRKLVD